MITIIIIMIIDNLLHAIKKSIEARRIKTDICKTNCLLLHFFPSAPPSKLFLVLIVSPSVFPSCSPFVSVSSVFNPPVSVFSFLVMLLLLLQLHVHLTSLPQLAGQLFRTCEIRCFGLLQDRNLNQKDHEVNRA